MQHSVCMLYLLKLAIRDADANLPPFADPLIKLRDSTAFAQVQINIFLKSFQRQPCSVQVDLVAHEARSL